MAKGVLFVFFCYGRAGALYCKSGTGPFCFYVKISEKKISLDKLKLKLLAAIRYSVFSTTKFERGGMACSP